MTRLFRIGLIVNPFAGIGGPTALKGSDGKETRELALARGAVKQANNKTARALNEIVGLKDKCEVFTAAGEMGEDVAHSLGLSTQVVYVPAQPQTEADDTQRAAQALLDAQVDILVFAGGDGTATDIFSVIEDKVAVLGIPAGCKIHSGVYAVSPSTAGKVLQMMLNGDIVSVRDAEVRDIDEVAFRQGTVIARPIGEMRVPEELRYIQAVKMGGKESDELLLADFGDQLSEWFEDYPDSDFVIGSGSTIDGAMREIGLDNTLLGVDLVRGGEVIAQDATADQLLNLCAGKDVKIVVTLIGGQGHIFGRGNQQISPNLIRQAGNQNIMVVASKNKLQNLARKPIVVDTGDSELDASLTGMITVTTGYHDSVLYPVTDYNNE